MANPTVGDVHISTALTNVSVGWAQAATNFVAEVFAPIIPVQKQYNSYFVYDQGDWMRSDAEDRAPGTESAGGGYRISSSAYQCDRKAIHKDIDDPTRANADPAINPDIEATEYVTEQIVRAKEIDFTSTFFTTLTWTGASSTGDMTGFAAAGGSTAAGFLQWNDPASMPIEDVQGEVVAIAQRIGRKPNKLLIGPQVFYWLQSHPDIQDRIKHTQRGVVTEDLLASLFGLDEVKVGWATYNTGYEEGADSFSFHYGKNALLAYVNPTPGLRQPTAMLTFVWTGQTGVPARGVRIKRFRLERNESDRIEGETWFDHKVISSAAGAFFSGAVA
jgi:hypothetical protein